jgi:SNF2 family DNA or RNA helicase
MVFDEGHRLATMNPNAHGKNTQMGYATMKARKRSRMALNLTGTTIMNHAEDMFGQLHYLYPEPLYNDDGSVRANGYRAKWRDYNNRFLDYVDVGGGRKVCIGFKAETLPDLRRELGVFSVYRTKAEELDLPPVIHQEILLDLEPGQRRVYDDMRDQFWAMTDSGAALKAGNVLGQLNNLRQIATWVDGVPSAKLAFALNEMLEEPDEQWVFFTWYKAPGRAFAELLGDEAAIVDGDVSKKDRVLNLRRHKRGDARVLIGSIETIGESLNLQYCSRAVRVDRHWNPGKNSQTKDRLIRDGQTESVVFYDLIARDTVDELRVQPALTSKESLRKAVFGS